MYDVSAQPMLTEKAAALVTANRAQFDEHTRMAERLLGLTGTSYSGVAGDDLALAIAIQINFQLASGHAPYIEQSSADKGTKAESVVYRNPQPLVDPRAQSIVDGVLADLEAAGASASQYMTLRSIRTPCSR